MAKSTKRIIYIKEISSDGINWSRKYPYQFNYTDIPNSSECETPTPTITQWVIDYSSSGTCSGTDLYYDEKEQSSTDGGITWTDTGNSRMSSTLKEAQCEACGYVPPTPTEYCISWTPTSVTSGTKYMTINDIEAIYFNNHSGSYCVEDYDVIDNCYGMFWDCYGLTSLNLSNFDSSNVTGMGGMFYNCSGLTSLNLSNFDTANVTDMDSMFENCRKLTSIDVSSFNTNNVENMANMFCNCYKLTELNLSNFDTSNITNTTGMFYNCSGITTLNLSNWDLTNLNNPVDELEMFYNCSSLQTVNMTNCDCNTVNKIRAELSKAEILSQVTIITDCEFDNVEWLYDARNYSNGKIQNSITSSQSIFSAMTVSKCAINTNYLTHTGTTYNDVYTKLTSEGSMSLSSKKYTFIWKFGNISPTTSVQTLWGTRCSPSLNEGFTYYFRFYPTLHMHGAINDEEFSPTVTLDSEATTYVGIADGTDFKLYKLNDIKSGNTTPIGVVNNISFYSPSPKAINIFGGYSGESSKCDFYYLYGCEKTLSFEKIIEKSNDYNLN